jgi:hypothetical protein
MKKQIAITGLALLGILGIAIQLVIAKASHVEYRAMTIAECTACHQGEGVAPNHGSFWVREHKTFAVKAGTNCADCHDQAYCLDCHTGGGIEPDLTRSLSRRGEYMPKSHRSDWLSIHSLNALSNPQNCYRCHDATYCFDCHSRVPGTTMNIKSHVKTFVGQDFIWNSEHSREARRNLQSCQSCHPEGDVCLKCHSAKLSVRVNPHPKDWNGSKLKSASGDRTCRVCH